MKEPKIRFKGFRGKWEESTLGKISTSYNYGINAAAIQYDGTNKYLRITDIDENTRMFSQEDLTSPGTDLSCCNDYLLEDGDITIARTGASVGKSYIYHLSDGKVYFAGFLIRTRLNDNVDKDCVFYSTLTDKYAKYIRLVSQRSGQPGVNVEELKGYTFNLPCDKAEQQSIASYFQHLDSLIQSTTKKIESLKQVKAASLQSMFPQEGETTPHVRFKGFEGEWEKVKFGEVAKIRRGLTYSPFNLRDKGIRVLRSSHIDEDTFVISENDVFVNKECINIEYAEEGDILVTAANGSPRLVGKHAIINNIGTNTMVVGGFMLLISSNESTFLNASMSSSWYSQFLKVGVAGGNGAIGNLNKQDLEDCELLIPNKKEERNHIASYFTSLDRQITLQSKRLEKLKQIKAACLDNMFV